MANLIKLRRGSAAQWQAANPVLAEGEPGYDTTNSLLKIGDGTTPWNQLSGFLDEDRLTIAYTSVGEANINVAAFDSIAEAMAQAPSGAKRLWLSAPEYIEAVELDDHTALQGAGSSRTTIKLPDGANTPVITNANTTDGNDFLSLSNITIDGNRENQAGQAAALLATDGDGDIFGIGWHKVRNWSLHNVEIKNVDGTGAYIIGDGTVTPPSYHGSVVDVLCHDNALNGFHIGGAMRRVTIVDLKCIDNARDGAWLDASELQATGVHCYRNGRDGIWIRNTFASSYWSLKSNRNGRHGIRALGLVACDGGGWSANSNGAFGIHRHPQSSAATDSADIWFDGDGSYSYGRSAKTTVTGILCGPTIAAAPWQEGLQEQPDEDWALRVDPNHLGDLHLLNVRAVAPGSKGFYSLPPWGAGQFVLTDSPYSTGTLRQLRGAQKSYGPIHPGDSTQVGPGLWAGPNAPANNMGANGDFYFRSGASATGGQRIYNKQSGVWTGLL